MNKKPIVTGILLAILTVILIYWFEPGITPMYQGLLILATAIASVVFLLLGLLRKPDKTLVILIACLFSASLVSCSKDDDDTQAAQLNSFGVLQVHFGNVSINQHHTIVSDSANTVDKITPLGIASDTIHLAPGIYNALVLPIFTQQSNIEYEQFTVTITSGITTTISVPF
jgi:hypothetical protein